MKKKKSKKRKNQTNKKTAKQRQVLRKVQSNKKQNQATDLTFWKKIERYKEWFPFGVLSFLIPFYISYYPDSLEVESKILGRQSTISNAIILTNPNSYSVKNININTIGVLDAVFLRPNGYPIIF